MNILELKNELTKRNINMPDADICRLWGMDTASFSRKKKLGTEIKQKNIQQLEELLKIDLIGRDRDLSEINSRLEKIKKNLGISDGYNANLIKIPYRPEVYLSAGYGVEVQNEAAQFMTIDSRLLTTEKGTKINPEYCEIVSISGNSMYPEYRHGDRVIIDRGDTELADGHIFAFRYKGQCYVKEINLLGNKIKCISLNKEYDPFYIEESEDFMVLGRILPRIRL